MNFKDRSYRYSVHRRDPSCDYPNLRHELTDPRIGETHRSLKVARRIRDELNSKQPEHYVVDLLWEVE